MNYSPEEQELIRLSDIDNQRIIEAFVRGEKFSLEFIRSLNVDDNKKECLDYNEHIKYLKYYAKMVNQFENYIETMKGWY